MIQKFLILSACIAVTATGISAQKRFSSSQYQAKSLRHAAPRAALMKASSVTDYIYIDNQWQFVGNTIFKYDSKGNVIEETVNNDGESYVTTYTYDDFGNVTQIITTCTENDVTSNLTKRTYVYDPVVRDYCIERMGYDWDGSEWVSNYFCETNTLTRNSEGNITENVKSLPMLDSMSPAYKMAWNYNSDTGKADEYTYYMNYSGADVKWTLNGNLSYRDIEWDRTNGQMTDQIEQLLSGPNRVKSYTIYYEDEIDGYSFVEYAGEDSDDYTLKSTFSDPEIIGETVKRETIDKYGSYAVTRSEYFDASGNHTEEPTYVTTETVEFDDKGNLISDEIVDSLDGGEPELVAGMQMRYSYSKEGLVLETIELAYDYDDKAYFPQFKSVYNDYTDISGIEGISSEKPEYTIGKDCIAASAQSLTGIAVYDMQGRKIRSTKADGNGELDIRDLPKGIYILQLEGTGISVKFTL